MGSVQRRPKEGKPRKGPVKWVARYRDASGKEHSKTHSTEREAKAWVADQERALRRGEWISPEDEATTLRDLATEWMDAAVKENTIANRRALLENLGELADIPIGKIRPANIAEWNALLLRGRPWKKGKPLSSSTVAVMTGQVSGLLKNAQRDGLLVRTPRIAAAKAPPKMAVSRQEVVTAGEVAKVIQLATNGQKNKHGGATPPRPWLADMVRVAASTGMRVSEICALHPEDVDMLCMEISVVRQARPGGMSAGPLKTERPRVIPMPAGVGKLLQARIEDDGVGPGMPIFAYEGHGAEGRVYHDRNSAGRAMKRVSEMLGGREITFHMFRHFYASVMIGAGASVADVQQALGHANASTTLNTYLHLFSGHEERVRVAADTAFNLVRDSCGMTGGKSAGDDLAARRSGRSGA